MSNNTIYVPFLSKKLAQLANNVYNVHDVILVIMFLTAHRAQISMASLGILPKDKILQLESMKWNSRLLANAAELKRFYALVAICETLSQETENLLPLNSAKAAEYLDNLSEVLSQEAKPRNARVISNAAITQENLNVHRHGKMAQYIGLLQAKPVFEPANIVKGAAVSVMGPGSFLDTALATLEKLEIQPLPETVTDSYAYFVREALKTEGTSESEAKTKALSYLLSYTLGWAADYVEIFDDAIGFGSDNNLLPLEVILPISRPINTVAKNVPNLTEEQMNNPFLREAADQLVSTNNEIKARNKGGQPKSPQSKAGLKSTAPPSPPSRSKRGETRR
jgi:hypothetical protein